MNHRVKTTYFFIEFYLHLFMCWCTHFYALLKCATCGYHFEDGNISTSSNLFISIIFRSFEESSIMKYGCIQNGVSCTVQVNVHYLSAKKFSFYCFSLEDGPCYLFVCRILLHITRHWDKRKFIAVLSIVYDRHWTGIILGLNILRTNISHSCLTQYMSGRKSIVHRN